MANNCLVTKLKDVVNNDKLVKVGELYIKLLKGGAPTLVTGNKVGTDRIVSKYIGNGRVQYGNGEVIADNDNVLAYSRVFARNSDGTAPIIDDAVIRVQHNYTMNRLECNDCLITDFNSVFYTNNPIYKFVYSFSSETLPKDAFNIDKIQATSLSTLDLTRSNAIGSFSSLLQLTNLTTIIIPYTSISGNADVLINNGQLTLPNLTSFTATSVPNLILTNETITALRALGVTVNNLPPTN